MNILEAAGIPYYFDEETNSYAISRSFFLPAINLTIDESLALLLASRKMIGQLPLPLFDQASRAAIKIESSLPAVIRDHCGSIMDRVDFRWPAIADDDSLDETFHTIRQAIENQRKVMIHYESLFDAGNKTPAGRVVRTVISPYRLVFIHRAWYVIGFSSHHKQIRTFKLSRIAQARLLDEIFAAQPDFSLEEYLGDAWVMIPEGKKYNVELIFSPKVARNVAEVSWHKSQRCEFLPDGSLKFNVQVDGLMEISWWILGYGDNVRVVKPARLVKIIKETAERMVKLYSDSGKDEK